VAVRLNKTDVVIVGLGAVGGVAALPLAEAGLDVIGLEVGDWLTRADFAPDELRNNVRCKRRTTKFRYIVLTRRRRTRAAKRSTR